MTEIFPKTVRNVKRALKATRCLKLGYVMIISIHLDLKMSTDAVFVGVFIPSFF
ncbi:hypothetical protein AAULR_24691 [Lacticaseibacillus rhamnosus MTCC 5462]|nr:hypothetical protein AAULR_24691 [Lacticaseibacillus rhamnosus MTCC 5462]